MTSIENLNFDQFKFDVHSKPQLYQTHSQYALSQLQFGQYQQINQQQLSYEFQRNNSEVISPLNSQPPTALDNQLQDFSPNYAPEQLQYGSFAQLDQTQYPLVEFRPLEQDSSYFPSNEQLASLNFNLRDQDISKDVSTLYSSRYQQIDPQSHHLQQTFSLESTLSPSPISPYPSYLAFQPQLEDRQEQQQNQPLSQPLSQSQAQPQTQPQPAQAIWINENNFPPADAFFPPSNISSSSLYHSTNSTFRDRFFSETAISTRFDSITSDPLQDPHSPKSMIETSSGKFTHPKYKIVRGISSGGTATKPPKIPTLPNHQFKQVQLKLNNISLDDLCFPEWNELEKSDKRRIIRLERYQIGNKIYCDFKILGSAKENPIATKKSLNNGVSVLEVSCLEVFNKPSDDLDEDESAPAKDDLERSFYVTSVEVIKIVELLIGVESEDLSERRRERGRIRSNLVPFWSRKSISSKMSNINDEPKNDFKIELATRIMGYEIRKPRGFDKEVRILKWQKLFKALKRALQSYYVEIPNDLDTGDYSDDEQDEEE
ncbi:hypothetical protein WICMUC_001219 [Wickerhamomyces mucosus]|uniref:DUF7082 domain-containing protein n=1 Tax=Wickerhamomyces mucosus TaxID=1378264 RepID=A0A9P8THI5_9ASCO|nr:hypothetical protein WICMUC_001219 [Wickerhamomyces mucosus]